ncbi:hypothetical protein WR25_16014 [Diploscapter pachys]|uniref:Uncharacterized protein n=1 Tax=Diploscapter pachys TaxID=2018661 RepID=A0A2A2M3E3_9BILA|nr:hypothetical protein WR25_16014 [Diploscapter pachys]
MLAGVAEQGRIVEQGQVGLEDRGRVLLAARQVAPITVNGVAHFGQGRVQRLVLCGGIVVAVIGRQADPVQPGQWPLGQPGGGADTGKHAGPGSGLGHGGAGRRVRGMALTDRGCLHGGGQRQQRGLAVWPGADQFDFGTFANAQAHDRHQAVEVGLALGEAQHGMALETLRSLAQQGSGAGVQAAVMSDPGVTARAFIADRPGLRFVTCGLDLQ